MMLYLIRRRFSFLASDELLRLNGLGLKTKPDPVIMNTNNILFPFQNTKVQINKIN